LGDSLGSAKKPTSPTKEGQFGIGFVAYSVSYYKCGDQCPCGEDSSLAALIAMLILRLLQLSSQFKWSFSNLVALLRMNLFGHRDLWAWLNEPFETPPVPYEMEQLPLGLG
jgi:hypothetical protein